MDYGSDGAKSMRVGLFCLEVIPASLSWYPKHPAGTRWLAGEWQRARQRPPREGSQSKRSWSLEPGQGESFQQGPQQAQMTPYWSSWGCLGRPCVGSREAHDQGFQEGFARFFAELKNKPVSTGLFLSLLLLKYGPPDFLRATCSAVL